MKTNEIKNEIDKTKKWEEMIKIKDLKHETNKYKLDFKQFKTIRSSVDNIDNDKNNKEEAEKKQNNIFGNILNFDNKSRQK